MASRAAGHIGCSARSGQGCGRPQDAPPTDLPAYAPNALPALKCSACPHNGYSQPARPLRPACPIWQNSMPILHTPSPSLTLCACHSGWNEATNSSIIILVSRRCASRASKSCMAGGGEAAGQGFRVHAAWLNVHRPSTSTYIAEGEEECESACASTPAHTHAHTHTHKRSLPHPLAGVSTLWMYVRLRSKSGSVVCSVCRYL